MMEHLDAALRLVAPNLSSGGPVKAGDFLVTIYIAFGLLLLRAVSQAVVLPGLSAAFRRRMGDAGPKAAFGAFDNFWCASRRGRMHADRGPQGAMGWDVVMAPMTDAPLACAPPASGTAWLS